MSRPSGRKYSDTHDRSVLTSHALRATNPPPANGKERAIDSRGFTSFHADAIRDTR